MGFQGKASVIHIDPLKLKQEQHFKTTRTQAEWSDGQERLQQRSRCVPKEKDESRINDPAGKMHP